MTIQRFVLLAVVALSIIALAGCAGPKPHADACSEPQRSDIKNFCIVSPGLLFRGAKPDVDGATELVTRGVRTVVNLELLHDDKDAFLAVRSEIASPMTIRYFRVRDWEPNVVVAPALLDEHIAAFIAITKTQPKPIYVHCRSGQNRTGVMVAAYRILIEGQPIDSAIGEMQRYNGYWFKEDAAYLRALVGERRARIEATVASLLVASVQPSAVFNCAQDGCALQ